MSRMRAMLRHGGSVLLEMPNIEAWDKRFKRWLVNHKLHARRYPADFVAGHCNEFSWRPLQYLARETGFVLVHWETYSKKRLGNLLYNRLPIGNKARALLQRRD